MTKVLITYSSGYGTTREVAERIVEVFRERGGMLVTLKSIDHVNSIDEFDAVIVGSSIRADRPLANVRDFFATNRQALANKDVAIFAVCLSANCTDGRNKVKREYISQITEKYPELNPFSVEAFGGKIDFDQLNPIMQKLMMRVLEKTGVEDAGPVVDTRDWGFIDAWAHKVYDLLNGQH